MSRFDTVLGERKPLIGALIHAMLEAIEVAVEGGSDEEALMKAAEVAADKAAQMKFGDFKS